MAQVNTLWAKGASCELAGESRKKSRKPEPRQTRVCTRKPRLDVILLNSAKYPLSGLGNALSFVRKEALRTRQRPREGPPGAGAFTPQRRCARALPVS